MRSPTRAVLPVTLLGVVGLLPQLPGLPLDTGGPSGPVVLELFTSQGCSSCPPADLVLSRLGLDPSTREKVVPLAFHVDYWNRIGWTDPFSSAEWTARQQAYNRALGTDGPYTPQLVVGGQSEMNGASERRVRDEIRARLEGARASRLTLAARQPSDASVLSVEVTAEMTQTVRANKLQLLLALFESGLVTPIERGENEGRTLRNDFIVRRLATAFSLEPTAGTREQKSLTLKLHPSWKRENLGVAAFLQDPGTMRIHGATLARVQPPR